MALTVAELVATLGLDDGPLNRDMNGLGGRFKGAGGKLMGVAAGLAKTGGVAIAAAVGTSLAMGFKRLTAIENAEASLRGLGHSAKDVQRIMDNALASVKGTAYGLDEAATIAGSAVAAGIQPGKDLERVLKLTADAATIGKAPLNEMGAIFNKVAASGKVSAREINQLHLRGIPIVQLLGKTLGKTTAEVYEMSRRGELDFATFAQAMEDGLGGSALASGNTTMGALRNVGAAAGRLGASLLSGVFPIFKQVFGGAITLLDSLTEKVGPVAEALGDALGGALQSEGFKDFLSDVGSAIETVVPLVLEGFQALGNALVDAGLMDVLEEFWGHIQTLGGEVKKTLDHLVAWWAEHGDEVKAVLGPLWDAVKATFEAIFGVIQGVMNIIAGIIRTVLAVIRGDWSGAWNGIKQIARGAGQVIVAIVKGLSKLAVAALQLAWNLLVAATRAAWNALKNAVSSGVSRVVGFVRSLPGKIRSAIGNLGSLLVQKGRDLIAGLIRGVTEKAQALYDKLAGVASRIAGFIHFSHGPLYPVGQKLMAGLAAGIAESARLPRLAMADVAGAMTVAPLSARVPLAAGSRRAASEPVVVHEHHHVHLPGGTALVGMASEVGSALAPHVGRSADAAARHRARRR